jgi:hypothetical protein
MEMHWMIFARIFICGHMEGGQRSMSKVIYQHLQLFFTDEPETFQSPNEINMKAFNNVISQVSTILMKPEISNMLQSGVCSVKQ